MPITISRPVRDLDNAGIRARRVFTLTGPTSYVSPEPFTASQCKLAVIECFGGGGAATFSSGSAVRIAVWDPATQTVRFFIPNTGAEVAGGVDLSTFVARVEIMGK